MTMKAKTPRPLGKTGLTVTALGLGTAPLGGLYNAVSAPDAMAVLEAGWDAGIRYFDSAPMYGLTRAEHLLGRLLQERTEDFVISTKVGRLMMTERAGRTLPPAPPKNPFDAGFQNALPFREIFDYSYDGVMRSFDDSQQRLGLRRLDILFVHDIGPVTHGERQAHHWSALTKGGGFRALQELKAHRDIAGFGLGVNEWEVIRDALEETDLDACLLAGRYTLLDRSAAEVFLPLAQKRDVAIAVGGAFNSGILAAPPGGLQKFNYVDASSDVIARVEALRAVCADHGVPLPAAAIQFPLRHPAVATVVIGAQTKDQLHQNIAWFDTDLPDSLWADLDAFQSAG
ncbi:aldo/keto reductase [Acidisoma cellulosilytica]|uniref:Aldo/keto reductase n=1 Tax=Acidisoma cellulosilyticum TaxID=2802395 RepID=A0A963Z0C6_9PROT|nr:aldo/keto reductase [Acidisoma cellulosilyticum]MCB8880522.1 aldo/keto reductase [Acidisoma cellulosilyticum]